MQKNSLILIGSGSHSHVILDCAKLMNYQVEAIIDVQKSYPTNVNKEENIEYGFETLDKFDFNQFFFFVSLGDNLLRKKYFELCLKKSFKPINLIHPRSFISSNVTIEKGIFVNVNVVINSRSIISKNTIINTSSIIEHDVQIGENTHIGPGSTICGNVCIGKNVLVGAGSTIIPKITVGNNVIIGSGSVIIENIPDNCIVAGVPGKYKKKYND